MSSKYILILIGIAFFILGFLHFYGLAYIPPIAFIGYMTAGILFVLDEMIEKIHKRCIQIPFISVYKFIIKLLAICSIVIVPLLNYENSLNDFVYPISMFSFGLLFVIVANDEIFNYFENLNTIKDKQNTEKDKDIRRSEKNEDISFEDENTDKIKFKKNIEFEKTKRFKIDDIIKGLNGKKEKEKVNKDKIELKDKLNFYFEKFK